MHVAIVGGGIGGLTAALALARRGMAAEVYEAAPAFRPVGAGIWVPPNALAVLDRLGVGESVIRAGVSLERAELRDARTGMLQAVDMRPFVDRFGVPNVSIARSELHRVLVESLDAARLHVGRRCVQVISRPDGAVVSWDDGGTTEADLVIGADGVQSVTRRAVFPNAVLRYGGQSCHLGITRGDLPAAVRSTSWEVWNGWLRFGLSPIGPQEMYWFAPFVADAGGTDETPGLAEALASRYRDFPDPIPDLIRRTRDEDILRTDLYDLRPLPRWSAPGIVLIGDAAHATTPNLGQGGAQAIEDAYVLADAIASHGATPAACAHYERKRRSRAHGIVRMSRRIGRLAHLRSRWLCAVRNAAIRTAPSAVNDHFTRRLFTLPY